ncbi:MAG: hypothetical protein REJ50_03020 [Bordetella sp.]|nr:hypothetical protein [Bordetella sp.]
MAWSADDAVAPTSFIPLLTLAGTAVMVGAMTIAAAVRRGLPRHSPGRAAAWLHGVNLSYNLKRPDRRIRGFLRVVIRRSHRPRNVHSDIP